MEERRRKGKGTDDDFRNTEFESVEKTLRSETCASGATPRVTGM